MAYNELIKNFEKIRAYMQEFYVYGFKTRGEYDQKSPRSYDDEKRRLESWLGPYMDSAMTPEGKQVFLSIDSRQTQPNPLFRAWKARSFTDGDITLHFLLIDILSDDPLSLAQVIEAVDGRLFEAGSDMAFDESTIRKKLQEYTRLGLVRATKQGRQMRYCRMPDTDLSGLEDVLDYFSESAPCGVIGSFLLDRLPRRDSPFRFKHHYITQTMDSGVLAALFDAMQGKRCVTLRSFHKQERELTLVPLRIYISAQNGRQYLIAWREGAGQLSSYRLDTLSQVRPGPVCGNFDALRQRLDQEERHMWGVNLRQKDKPLEHIEFDIRVHPHEGYILQRLHREKRRGCIQQLDEHTYRYRADVYDTIEMIPWIRTFLCRITRLECSNTHARERFLGDLEQMYQMYGLEGGDNV